MTITCKKCGRSHEIRTYQLINVSHQPELKEELKAGELSLAVCPHCGHRTPLKYDTLYHDPDKKLMLWMCTDQMSATKADAIIRQTPGVDDYTIRLVDSFGDMIEKVCITDCDLDDVTVELCKYVAKLDLQETMKGDSRLEAIIDAPFRFLRCSGADNALTFAYPLEGNMEMLEVPFSMYENCRAIIGRNPVFREHSSGLARIDSEWISSFIK